MKTGMEHAVEGSWLKDFFTSWFLDKLNVIYADDALIKVPDWVRHSPDWVQDFPSWDAIPRSSNDS
jgi:hypothetical protein